jgi:hypothetical protein
MGHYGAGIATDAAEVVITVENMERVANVIEVGQRMMRVARQGILFGMGGSIFLMLLASRDISPYRRRAAPGIVGPGGDPQRPARSLSEGRLYVSKLELQKAFLGTEERWGTQPGNRVRGHSARRGFGGPAAE